MKIALFTLSLLFLSTAFAQGDGKLSIETQFQPFNSSSTIENNLKIRYHFNESHVLRTNWRFSHSSITEEILETDGDGVGSVEYLTNGYYFSVGYERHFASDKISPYIGGSLGYGFGADDEYGSRTDGSSFINDFNYSEKQQLSSFFVDLYSGFDFTLYKGLYIGSEIGIRFLSTKHHRGEIRTEDASSTTDSSTTTSIPERKSSSLFLANMGIIRLGWKF